TPLRMARKKCPRTESAGPAPGTALARGHSDQRVSGLAVRVGNDLAGELGEAQGRGELAVLLEPAEALAVGHLPELPHAGAVDLGQRPVRVELAGRLGRRYHAAGTGLRVALEVRGGVVGQELHS